VLMAGNALSVRHPWRMNLPGGRGAAGRAGLGLHPDLRHIGMAVLLAIPTVVGRLTGSRLAALGGTTLLGAIAWLCWALSLGRAARSLGARREHVLATLTHPHETG
jgi:hypothetical protein